MRTYPHQFQSELPCRWRNARRDPAIQFRFRDKVHGDCALANKKGGPRGPPGFRSPPIGATPHGRCKNSGTVGAAQPGSIPRLAPRKCEDSTAASRFDCGRIRGGSSLRRAVALQAVAFLGCPGAGAGLRPCSAAGWACRFSCAPKRCRPRSGQAASCCFGPPLPRRAVPYSLTVNRQEALSPSPSGRL